MGLEVLGVIHLAPAKSLAWRYSQPALPLRPVCARGGSVAGYIVIRLPQKKRAFPAHARARAVSRKWHAIDARNKLAVAMLSAIHAGFMALRYLICALQQFAVPRFYLFTLVGESLLHFLQPLCRLSKLATLVFFTPSIWRSFRHRRGHCLKANWRFVSAQYIRRGLIATRPVWTASAHYLGG